jgi:hypothetical protein
VRAQLQFSGPVVVIWDNLSGHRSAALRQWAAKQNWLTIVQLPTYAPDLKLSKAYGRWCDVSPPPTSSPTAITWLEQSVQACAASSADLT